MKNKKLLSFTAIVMAIALLPTMGAFALTSAEPVTDTKAGVSEIVLYDAEDIQNDLIAYQSNKKISNKLKSVLKEPSYHISVPKIDISKISCPTKIADLPLKNAFYEELDDHSTKYDPDTITYSEYCAIEKTWTVDEATKKEMVELYPELADSKELSYGDFSKHQIAKDKQDFGKKWFTNEQLEEFKERGIQLDDVAFLLKEFHNANIILRQSDTVLKQVISDYYETNLVALESYAKVQKQATQVQEQTTQVQTLDIENSIAATNNLDLTKYTSVVFPQYNYGNADYFLNSVLTTMHWMVRQANRARKTQAVMYNTPYSTTSLQCTNMYGTYSYSQGGAHEGIDFAAASGTASIYSPTWGGRRYPTLYHQFAVHDPNHADGAKTYSYLHMSYLNSSIAYNDDVSLYQYIGNQGMEGNATGYHVHFEVHSGNTGALSSESDDVLGSISPYRLTEYIGEGDPLPEEEQYW